MGNQSGADRSLVAPLEQTPRSRRGNSRAHGGFSETPVCPLVDALVIHILVTNRRSALLWEDQLMNNDNVAAVRNAYAVGERKDLEGWINLFTPDGVFVDNSVGATYRGRALADPVRNYRHGVFQHAPRAKSHLCRWQCRRGATGPARHPRWPAAASLWRAACHG